MGNYFLDLLMNSCNEPSLLRFYMLVCIYNILVDACLPSLNLSFFHELDHIVYVPLLQYNMLYMCTCFSQDLTVYLYTI